MAEQNNQNKIIELIEYLRDNHSEDKMYWFALSELHLYALDTDNAEAAELIESILKNKQK